MYDVLKLCYRNCEYFSGDITEIAEKFHESFTKIAENLLRSKPILDKIELFAPDFDFDENTPGNGYRSFIFIFNAALKYTENTCKYIDDNRGKFLFRQSSSAK